MVMAIELSVGPFIRSARPAIGGALRYRPDRQTILTGKHGNAWSGPPVHPTPECRAWEFYPPGETEGFFGLRRPEVYLRHTPINRGATLNWQYVNALIFILNRHPPRWAGYPRPWVNATSKYRYANAGVVRIHFRQHRVTVLAAGAAVDCGGDCCRTSVPRSTIQAWQDLYQLSAYAVAITLAGLLTLRLAAPLLRRASAFGSARYSYCRCCCWSPRVVTDGCM